MTYCSKCGFKADSDDNFCARCGEELKEVNKEVNYQSMLHQANSENNKSSFSKILKESFKHTFFDNEDGFSKKRKIVNRIILLLIIIIGFSILIPYLDSIKISVGQQNSCKYLLDAKDLYVSEAILFDDNKMEILITNTKNEDVVLTKLAKTYEFKFDGSGETDHEQISLIIPSKKTLKVSFSVRKEPHIIGLEFSGCERIKVSNWMNRSS